MLVTQPAPALSSLSCLCAPGPLGRHGHQGEDSPRPQRAVGLEKQGPNDADDQAMSSIQQEGQDACRSGRHLRRIVKVTLLLRRSLRKGVSGQEKSLEREMTSG